MSFNVECLAISDVKLVTPMRFEDTRGYFSETYNAESYKKAGIAVDFIQDNHSFSSLVATVRGLHFQAPPFAQAKLVRVVRGAILDVAVDVRKDSPTYGKWVRAVLSSGNGVQMFVPRGFLHGFVTLQAATEVLYKVDGPYSKAHDGAVLWNDPDLAIDWGISPANAILSAKDIAAQKFAEFLSPF